MYFLSILMIFVSSYLVLSLISQKTDRVYGFLYLLLIAFSQIILSFEVLSLFSLINRNNFLICNFIFLIVSCLLFTKSERKFYIPEIKSEINRIKNSLKLDKTLMFCGVCFLFYQLFQVLTLIFSDHIFGDAYGYYFPRVIEWIQNGNLNHFMTGDNREIIMPINSELLYLMHFLFLKTEKFASVYSFTGYLACVYVIYLFVKNLFFSTRKALWSVFVFSSFALVILLSVVPCSELIAGGLILSSIYLFFINAKYKDNIALYFSSLALSLGLGVKTTVFMTGPSVLFVFLVIYFLYKPDKKCLLKFIVYSAFNFLLFSAFNYILNFLSFASPFSSEEEYLRNKSVGGIKGFIFNIVNYLFLFFDTSGIPVKEIPDTVNFLRSKLYDLLSLDETKYASVFFFGHFEYNCGFHIFESVLGATGTVAFLPALIYSIFYAPMTENKRKILAAALSLSLFISLVVLSYIMVFCVYTTKYFITFAIPSVCVLAYSYFRKNNLYKLFLVFLIFIYLFFNTGYIAYSVIGERLNLRSLKADKRNASPYPNQTSVYKNEGSLIYNKMKDYSPGRTALFIKQGEVSLYYIVRLVFKGYTFDKFPAEYAEKRDIKNYDYLITMNNNEIDGLTLISGNKGERDKNCIYFDEKNRVISDDKVARASVKCRVPHEYFAQNGFQYLFETDKYIVLKNGAK